MEWRVLAGLLLVSVAAVVVLLFGTVIPHLVVSAGHRQVVDTGWLMAATVGALITSVVASLIVARRMVAPMERILEASRAFAGGDHTVRVPDLGRPELSELMETLNSAASEVERLDEERRRLTADIAHELRTPLTVLQAGLEELRDGLVPANPGTLGALHDQATRLGRIVTDLSELSAVESDRLALVLGPVDLGVVAENALAARRGAISAAGLGARIVVAPGVVVVADGDRLYQVVGNLLTNSTTYCRPGDIIEIRVSAADGQGVLEVADTGPGLALDEQDHAFDRMWRGPSAQGTRGSGLGLSIVRALVVAQGGEVELSSIVGAGTVVRVILPLAG